MAGRPPLAVGTYGRIRLNDITKPGGPKTIRALTQFRDLDGRTRQVGATGASNAAAERALKEKLAARAGPTAGDLTGETRIRVAAERWFAAIQIAVEAGDRSPSTAAAYRSLLDRHVLPAVGELRLQEATVGRLDAVLQAVRQKAGAPTAKGVRTVLSGILGYAARQDAVTSNATRNTTPISTKPRKVPRALTVEECARWLKRLAADPSAVRHDLVDLTGFALATGARVGEILAVTWDDLDLSGEALGGACTCQIAHTIIRVPGKGLIRKTTKTATGQRMLRLPSFAVAMLRRRAAELAALKIARDPMSIFEDMAHTQKSGTSLPRSEARAGSLERSSGIFEYILSMSPLISVSAGQGHFSPTFEYFEDVFRRKTVEGQEDLSIVSVLSGSPVFPDSRGGWRDPSNTRRDLREARGEEFSWVTTHSFRKTAATLLDEAGLTARQIADQMGHSRVSMTQDVYLGRGAVDPQVAGVLDRLFGMQKPSTSDSNSGEHLA